LLATLRPSPSHCKEISKQTWELCAAILLIKTCDQQGQG